MANEKRIAGRKPVSGLTVSNIMALGQFTLLCRKALLVDASSTGFLLYVERGDLVPKDLRSNLDLSSLEGEHIVLTIAEMKLEIDGMIARTKLIGKGTYEVAIDFSADAPEYWRNCLLDLLPEPGEI